MTDPSTRPGDSGGPSYFNSINSAQVVGVHIKPHEDLDVTLPVNRDWIAAWRTGTWRGIYLGPTDVPLLGETARTPAHSAVDPDGDGLVDSHDNCPGLANANQINTDLDALGDVCDLCVGTVDRELVDADGDGRNDLTCDLCPVFDTGMDADDDGIVDECDTCALPDRTVAPGIAANCNRDVELALALPALSDRCDPVPCPEGELGTRNTALGIPPFVSTLESSAIVATPRRSRLSGSVDTAPAQAGFRYCACALADDDDFDARLACALPPNNCALDNPSLFAPPTPSSIWRTMSFDMVSGSCTTHPYGDDRCTLDYTSVRAEHLLDWKFTDDAAAWGVSTSTPDPHVAQLRGVLWSHTAGLYLECDPVCSSVPYEGDYASHFASGISERRPRPASPGWPDTTPFFPSLIPPSDCPACGWADRLGWLIADPCIFASCGIDKARVRYPGFDREGAELTNAVPELRSAARFIPATDPDRALSVDHPLYVGLAWDASSILATLIVDGATGKLVNGANRLASIPPLTTVDPSPAPSLGLFSAVYRAAELAVYVLGAPQGEDAQLVRLDVVSGGYTTLPLSLPQGQRVTAVHALGFRAQDDALFALVDTAEALPVDGQPPEPWTPVAAIIRIPRDGGDASIAQIVGNAGYPQYPSHALLFDSFGRLILVGYGWGGFVAVRAPVDDLDTADAYHASGDVLLSEPYYDGTGLSYLRWGTVETYEASGTDEGEFVESSQLSLPDAY